MRRRTKIILKVTGAVLLLLVIAATFLPLFESHFQYCFYCGRETLSARVLGVPVPLSGTGKSLYCDSIVMPSHTHRMIECNGGRMWAFRGQQFWDEFGWTGRPYRDALLAGIDRTPELRNQIVAAYLMVNPDDREGARKFLDAYRKSEVGAVPQK